MPSIFVELPYRVNVHLPLHAEDVLDGYLSSISVLSDTHLRSIKLREIDTWIEACFEELEKKLLTLFFLQAYRDTTEYRLANSHGGVHINVRFCPVDVKRVSIKIGTYNSREAHDLPKEIINFRHDSGRTKIPIRRVHLIPYLFGRFTRGQFGAYSLGADALLLGIGSKSHNNFWETLYLTGFNRLPEDVKDYIKLDVSAKVAVVIGETLFGVGISSYSLSTEGMSQNVSSSSGSEGGGALSGTVRGWNMMMKMKMKNLNRAYLGARIYNG